MKIIRMTDASQDSSAASEEDQTEGIPGKLFSINSRIEIAAF